MTLLLLLAALVTCAGGVPDCSNLRLASDTTPEERTDTANTSIAIAEAAVGTWTLAHEVYELNLSLVLDPQALPIRQDGDVECETVGAPADAAFTGGALATTSTWGSCHVGTDDAYSPWLYCNLNDETQGIEWDVKSEVAGEIIVLAWPGMIGLDPDEEEGMVPLEGWTRVE